ncbi:protein-L-isoaspartate O-methyltransferase family protein [Chitinilyticum piscinae]|uniref:Protein-L-isoaspartate O-methyltransferase n=1 Tax=Chitinilyticum piscinae TaxID=2866724 RepID=A0A8J7K2M0_9NEIS|nr:protein-L-isoaspartate O-methyltransferase [Chitinilyticum piscinae]MBE9610646.1 protein-L-isoaspartate O-methyltransferase [Chitinilyticum piscinae]
MDWERARYLMVEQQIRTWNVTDLKVLQRFMDVKREDFVPADKRELAFADIELPVGNGRFMLAPKIEGKFLQAASIKPTDKVLVVGAATGYLVALASGLAQQAYGVESDAGLVVAANSSLKAAGIKNAEVLQGDMLSGLAQQAPFDVILISGAFASLPEALKEQLVVSGRILAVLGHIPVKGCTRIVRSSADVWNEEVLFEYPLASLYSPACKEQTFTL